MLKNIDNTLNMNAAFDLLRKCNTAAEFRVYCAAEGIDADSLVWACLRYVAILFKAKPEKISKDFTVEDLYKYRPKNPPPAETDDVKFVPGQTIVEFSTSFYCIEYDMIRNALINEYDIS